jgi:hypothetical protein
MAPRIAPDRWGQPLLRCARIQHPGRGREAVEQQHILRMTRRTVLAGIAAALAPGARIAQAQQRDGVKRLGVLLGNAPKPPVLTPNRSFNRSRTPCGRRDGSKARPSRSNTGSGVVIRRAFRLLRAGKPQIEVDRTTRQIRSRAEIANRQSADALADEFPASEQWTSCCRRSFAESCEACQQAQPGVRGSWSLG